MSQLICASNLVLYNKALFIPIIWGGLEMKGNSSHQINNR
jgi:hypothetical protein